MTKLSGVIGEGRASRHDAAGGKRRRAWRAAFIALAAAGVVGAAAWVVFDSPLLAVRSVTITGTHLVPASDVLSAAGIQTGTPLIRVNTGQVAARVDAIRQVRGARVTRAWPNRVIITVREWTPALALAAPGGGYDLADAVGVVLQRVTRRPADLPLYPARPGRSLRGDPDFAAAAAVVGELPAWLRHAVQSVTAPSPDQVTLQLASHVTVVWGGTDRAAAKARELTALMATHMHYYDVSAPGSALTR
jgi:cell division protein FtsQ